MIAVWCGIGPEQEHQDIIQTLQRVKRQWGLAYTGWEKILEGRNSIDM